MKRIFLFFTLLFFLFNLVFADKVFSHEINKKELVKARKVAFSKKFDLKKDLSMYPTKDPDYEENMKLAKSGEIKDGKWVNQSTNGNYVVVYDKNLICFYYYPDGNLFSITFLTDKSDRYTITDIVSYLISLGAKDSEIIKIIKGPGYDENKIRLLIKQAKQINDYPKISYSYSFPEGTVSAIHINLYPYREFVFFPSEELNLYWDFGNCYDSKGNKIDSMK